MIFTHFILADLSKRGFILNFILIQDLWNNIFGQQ